MTIYGLEAAFFKKKVTIETQSGFVSMMYVQDLG